MTIASTRHIAKLIEENKMKEYQNNFPTRASQAKYNGRWWSCSWWPMGA
jgi:hypothetical protein